MQLWNYISPMVNKKNVLIVIITFFILTFETKWFIICPSLSEYWISFQVIFFFLPKLVRIFCFSVTFITKNWNWFFCKTYYNLLSLGLYEGSTFSWCLNNNFNYLWFILLYSQSLLDYFMPISFFKMIIINHNFLIQFVKRGLTRAHA